jgi:hypothetical protein
VSYLTISSVCLLGANIDEPSKSDIEHAMFVLNVDLWSEDALKEVNLVRHTTATPSISSTSPASYAQIEQATPAYSHILPSNRDMGYSQQMAYPPPGQVVNPYGMQQSYAPGKLSDLFITRRALEYPF